MSSEKAILVTGCSGFIGTKLISKLSSQNKTVVAMYKKHLPKPMANIYPVCSDMSSSELIAAPLRGVDTVVHLAWQSPYTSSFKKNIDIKDQLPQNIVILQNLITAMEKAKTPKIIYISAIGASKESESLFLKEKYLSEFYILNSKIPNKIILRSSVVYDPETSSDRFINAILKTMHYPLIYPVPDAKKIISPVNINDMVDTIISCINLDLNSEASILELSSSKEYKIEDLFKLVLNKYVKTSKLPIKGSLANFLLPIIEKKQNLENDISIKNFLTLGGISSSQYKQYNPLEKVIPVDLKDFKESLFPSNAQ